jgi:hypothetical protein
MKEKFKPSRLTLNTLKSLSDSISRSRPTLEWWIEQIIPMNQQERKPVLRELGLILAHNMSNISSLATSLKVSKQQSPTAFNCILFEFLLPIHHELVLTNNWDEALKLEISIYSEYIKQDENHFFYENAFSDLYKPYDKLFSGLHKHEKRAYPLIDKTYATNSNSTLNTAPEKTLFWLQNYNVLAHTQLLLDLARNLGFADLLYVSALTNSSLSNSREIFEQAGICIVPLNDALDVRSRCTALVELCDQLDIRNLVFVSLPLQSGFLRTLSTNLNLTWWSMKYPLGCFEHFDRLVCNRSLRSGIKTFYGKKWLCAPFAVNPICTLVKNSNAAKSKQLKVGVLSRTEKLASSQLPEILSKMLMSLPDTELFWTGRSRDALLEKRLQGDLKEKEFHRIHFRGWVDPIKFLNEIDLLIDTPNLGGVVAYWMMSLGKVVISATNSGSVGALGTHDELSEFFEYLDSPARIHEYFTQPPQKPYYLASIDLIPVCLKYYHDDPDNLSVHGQFFKWFFSKSLSDLPRWSRNTFEMLQGRTEIEC